MNPEHACNYAVLRFRPYRDTGEFVNLGVVLYCEAGAFFGFRLETRRSSRVTDFFPELEVAAFREARNAMHLELTRVADLFKGGERMIRAGEGRALFLELVRPRESIFRFGEIGTRLAEDPTATLDDLFRHYVHRQFAQSREYQEEVMANQLRDHLRAHDLWVHFASHQRVGNQAFHASLPIVSVKRDDAGRPLRAIKPLDLRRTEPTDIYEHGMAWVTKMKGLRLVDQAPVATLFHVRYPTGGSAAQRSAELVRDELLTQGAKVVPADDPAPVLEFARAAG